MSTWNLRSTDAPTSKWTVKRIGDMVRLVSGFPFASEIFGPSGDMPLVRIRDLLSEDFSTYLSGPVPASAIIDDGDVIIGMDGDFNVLVWRRGRAALNQRLCALRPRAGIDIRFVAYALPHVLSLINDLTFSTTVKHLSSTDVLREKLLLPPLAEQLRIADFLDAETARIDELCRLSNRQTEVLFERLNSAMRSLTTGATDEPVPTGIPWMPAISSKWRLGKVAHLFQTGSGTTPTAGDPAYFDGELPWINSSDVKGSVIRAASRHITAAAIREFPSLKKHSKGSLIIAMYGQGETKGRVAVLGLDAYVNQACCALSPSGELSVDFAYFWFRAFREGVVSLAFGAGQPNLSQDLIRGIRVPVPDLRSQQRIITHLAHLDSQVTTQRQTLIRRNELLRERRQALITAAVTGQFDVTTARGADLS